MIKLGAIIIFISFIRCFKSLTVVPYQECYPNISYRKYSIGKDLSWMEYLNDIYSIKMKNEEAMKLQTVKLLSEKISTIFYNHAKVDVILFGAYRGEGYMGQLTHWFKTREYTQPIFQSNQWVEVVHWSMYYLTNKFHPNIVYNEGYTDQQYTGYGILDHGRKLGWGCWFTYYQGSGVYINTGRLLVANDRYELKAMLGLDEWGCRPEYDCTEFKRNCNKNSYDTASIVCSNQDKFYCERAVALGYDSWHTRDYFREITFCNNACATEPFNSSCPAIELRTGYNGSLPCHCNGSYNTINCGKNYNSWIGDGPYTDPFNGTYQEGYPTKHFACFPQTLSDYNYIQYDLPRQEFKLHISFTANIIKDISSPTSSSFDSTSKQYDEAAAAAAVTVDKLKSLKRTSDIVIDIHASTNPVFDSVNELNLSKLGFNILRKGSVIHKEPRKRSFMIGGRYVEFIIMTDIVCAKQSICYGFLMMVNSEELTNNYSGATDENYSYESISSSSSSSSSTTSSSDSDSDKELIRWIIDESVCLRNKKARLVILVSKASYNFNHNIAKKTFSYIDAILGANSHSDQQVSCNGHYLASREDYLIVNSGIRGINTSATTTSDKVVVVQLGKTSATAGIAVGYIELEFILMKGLSIKSDVIIF